MSELVTLDEIRAAQRRIAGVAVRTELYRVPPERLRAVRGAELPFELYIKAESEQPIGSFKLRGAYNRIAQLTKEELGRGVITYSSGNHAQGVAYSARALGAKAVIVMPDNAPVVKIEATRELGAEVVFVGPASSARKAKAEELAEEFGYTIIPPYDDPAIIAGQGTCGLEIVEQLGLAEAAGEAHGQKGSEIRGKSYASGSFDSVLRTPLRMTADVVVLSPVSGGGLLSGVATAVKLAWTDASSGGAGVQVWGAEPELAADAKESFDTKTLVEWPAAKTTRTISDGLRTQSLGTRNFEHILRYVDGIVTVSEDEIVRAMRVMLTATGLVAEPSGAVTLAAALFHHAELPRCARMVAVLSGGNIEPEMRNTVEAGLASA
ncbi:MAG: threonine/serine dehydratase [Acidobacteriota bacterium]|nr:threonine/serine dehydratase [Acidobacteriota bacterium]